MKKKKKITRPVGKRPETTRCDGVTTYYRKGKLCHCSIKRFPGSSEERDRRRAARTLNQRQRASVFALVSRLVKILTRKLQDFNAWVSLAKTTNMTPANLCHKVNGTACDENGVANFRAFIFSVGWLAVPLFTRVTRRGWEITIEWRPHGIPNDTRDKDTLVIGYFYDSLPDAPRVLHLPNVTRAGRVATFTLPDPVTATGKPLSPDEIVHLYPYMAGSGQDEFSTSVYLRVARDADEILG